MQTNNLMHRELTYKIIGILYKIHTSLGCGLTEKIYRKAIEHELKKAGIHYETEKIGRFRLDLVIGNKIIVELKAVERLPKIFQEQLVSYLKASPYEVGLLVNFGASKLRYIRLVRSKSV